MTNISKFDDTIDSRDIVERFNELAEKRTNWAAGFNMCGYLPDMEPNHCAEWSDARDSLVWHIEQNAEQTDDADEANELQELAHHLNELNEVYGEFGATVCGRHYWISRSSNDGLTDAEREEFTILENVRKQGENLDDWDHGVQLVRYSYFKTHAQEIAEECGMIQSNAQWPYTCIDWDMAARDLQMDYTSIEFDAVTYWAR